jgi:type I site-specific restriction endonuclease
LRRISEERTRKEMIDSQLEKAGWVLRDHSKVKIEIPVDSYDAEPWNGVTDYCLYRENGEVLAVVEAKKTAVDVHCAEFARQGDGLFQPLLHAAFNGNSL